ncbi:hypothetical protein J6590_103831 [Homalodisca vitripennis]|nr:hypothetical protein J6590_103831 [Homalodisca vitripennis]
MLDLSKCLIRHSSPSLVQWKECMGYGGTLTDLNRAKVCSSPRLCKTKMYFASLDSILHNCSLQSKHSFNFTTRRYLSLPTNISTIESLAKVGKASYNRLPSFHCIDIAIYKINQSEFGGFLLPEAILPLAKEFISFQKTFSIDLESAGKSEIGRYLHMSNPSPFLKSVLNLAIPQPHGKTQLCNEVFIKCTSEFKILS